MQDGVPAEITLEFAEKWVAGRVSEKRLKHIKGVVAIAETLAKAHRCDPFQAKLAAWLHDCCKEMKDHCLIEMADALGVPVDVHQRARGHLLHGPVAAAVVSREFGITNQDILDAIAEHTLGKVDMTPLSEVLYLADCIEEGRPADFKDPINAALYRQNGSIDVEAGLVVAMNLTIQHLLESDRPIHPLTVEVRNHYLGKVKSRGA